MSDHYEWDLFERPRPDSGKGIWLLRHGINVLDPDKKKYGEWQPQSPLSAEGRKAIERVREVHMKGRQFALLRHSPYVRCEETAKIAVPDGKWEVMEGLAPRLPQVWDTVVLSQTPPISTSAELENKYPGLLQVEGEWMVKAIYEVLDRLPSGQEALLVGHQPLIGMARDLFKHKREGFDQSLPKGGIYRLGFSEHSNSYLNGDCLLPPE